LIGWVGGHLADAGEAKVVDAALPVESSPNGRFEQSRLGVDVEPGQHHGRRVAPAPDRRDGDFRRRRRRRPLDGGDADAVVALR